MSTVDLTDKTSPYILKLNSDLLHDIFEIIAPRNPDTSDLQYHDSNPLYDIHRASQVCRTWRDILLRSPSIWARCFYLDSLAQDHDHWRNLITQRATGQSLISVLGTIEWTNRGLSQFFINLLDEQWERIEVFNVGMDDLAIQLHDEARFWKVLTRPSKNLRTFKFCTYQEDNDTATDNQRSVLQLFSNYAPSLTQLEINLPDTFGFRLDIKAPMMSTRNLQRLVYMVPKLDLRDTDLLAACKQMPLLTELQLHITSINSIRDSSTFNSPSIHMPQLKEITLTGPTLDMYTHLLAHIIPHASCSLYAEMSLKIPYIRRPLERKINDTQHIQRIIRHYMDSHAEYINSDEGKEGDSPPLVELLLFPPYTFLFIFEYGRHVGIYVDDVPIEMFRLLLHTVSNFEYPKIVKSLRMRISNTYMIETAPMLKIFHATRYITSLSTSARIISYLGTFSNSENFFPCLKHLSLSNPYHFERGAKLEQIMPFFEFRHGTNPIMTLCLKGDYLSTDQPPGDCRFLNKLVGLQVSWHNVEYECGSGDGEQLLLVRTGEVLRDNPHVEG